MAPACPIRVPYVLTMAVSLEARVKRDRGMFRKMEQIPDMHDYATESLVLQLDLQALIGERLSNGDTDQPGGGVIPKVLDLLPTHFHHLRLLCDT